jgi:hypothetical protein
MSFTGLSTNELFAASELAEDISRIIATLSPKETPILNWLGDSDVFATSTKHEFFEDHMLPNYIVNSGAVNSATAATAFQTNGLGLALTEGTILENESTAPELMQVISIVGANSIVVSRNYGGGGIGSLAAGAQIYVRGMAGIEGQDHNGSAVRRLGVRKANTVGMFYIPVGVSGTDSRIQGSTLGRDTFNDQIRKGLVDALHQLEKEVVRGVLNSTNSLGSTTQTRTMQGIRTQLATINSTIAAASFAANPHLYIGNLWQAVYDQGGSPDTETWGIVAGSTFFRNISDLNDTKVEDSNTTELFKRVVREYVGPLGKATVMLSRVLPATELLLVPKERLKVVPLQGSSFFYEELGKSGDNTKGQIVGEYSLELFHEKAMARLRV